MKTKLFTLLLAVAASVGTMFAEKVKIGDLYYNLDATNQTAEVTSQNSSYPYWSATITTANIPASVEYNSVTYSVTSIGNVAFAECTGLTSVTIPNSVTSIGDQAFYSCTGLTSVTIPNSVTSIGYGAFTYCDDLTSVTIPNSVTSIGDRAFWGCTGLTSITIPNSVTSIGDYAFYQCTGLTSITIPNSVTSIGDYAFYQCTGLTSVTIPNSVTSIGDRAFWYCTGLTSVEIPNSVTSIGDQAFYSCTGLTSVTIGNSVTSIGSDAFSGCTGLASVTIGNSVTSIGNRAFSNCRGLTSVTIGNSVTRIGSDAFNNCGVNKINFSGTMEDWLDKSWRPSQVSSSYSLYINNVAVTDAVIPNSVTSIGGSAFYNCTGLTSVTIGNSVTSIGSDAFSGCTGLTSITIPNSVTSIGNRAFFNCTGLTSVTIPNSVTSIENSTFYGCTGLTSVTIPNSVTSIGSDAFSGCTGLTSVTIGNGVASIGERAFSGCTGLTSIIWNVKTYPDFTNNSTPFYYDVYASYKFDLRPQITSFVIGDDVEYVPAYLCAGMENLTTLSIGKSVAEIGNNAFSGLSNRKINQLALPNSLTTIGEKAFAGDAYLESIYFGSSLESIGKNAFDSCARVSTMTCLANVTPNVAENALASINSNAILYVLNSCLQKYKVDENWNRFVIEPLGTSDVLDPEDDVTVSADDNTATFTWPTNSAAESYKLVITKGGETICTLLFNGSGQLVGISFAPAHDGQSNAPAAILTAAGMQFTVTGLSYATRYTYVMTIKDGSNKVLATYSGSFGTTNAPESTEGFEPVSSSLQGGDGGRLILHNGQIYILRGDKTYTLTGQEIK